MKTKALDSFANGVLYAFAVPSRKVHIEDERFVISNENSNQRIINLYFWLATSLILFSLALTIIIFCLTNSTGKINYIKTGTYREGNPVMDSSNKYKCCKNKTSIIIKLYFFYTHPFSQ